MDGNVFPRDSSAERIRQSQELFRRRGVDTAIVKGDASDAHAFFGDDNTATVRGNDNFATAGFLENNTATVDGNDSGARAGCLFSTACGSPSSPDADNNTATVKGEGSIADAEAPNGCTAEAIGDGVHDDCPP